MNIFFNKNILIIFLLTSFPSLNSIVIRLNIELNEVDGSSEVSNSSSKINTLTQTIHLGTQYYLEVSSQQLFYQFFIRDSQLYLTVGVPNGNAFDQQCNLPENFLNETLEVTVRPNFREDFGYYLEVFAVNKYAPERYI